MVISPEQFCDEYANALDELSKNKYHIKILSSLYSIRTQYILFDAVKFQQIYCEDYFVLGDV